MRFPAAAIAWEFHRPHRWALAALAGYLVVIGIVKLLVLGPAPVSLDPPDGLAALGVVPFTVTFFYLLALCDETGVPRALSQLCRRRT